MDPNLNLGDVPANLGTEGALKNMNSRDKTFVTQAMRNGIREEDAIKYVQDNPGMSVQDMKSSIERFRSVMDRQGNEEPQIEAPAEPTAVDNTPPEVNAPVEQNNAPMSLSGISNEYDTKLSDIQGKMNKIASMPSSGNPKIDKYNKSLISGFEKQYKTLESTKSKQLSKAATGEITRITGLMDNELKNVSGGKNYKDASSGYVELNQMVDTLDGFASQLPEGDKHNKKLITDYRKKITDKMDQLFPKAALGENIAQGYMNDAGRKNTLEDFSSYLLESNLPADAKDSAIKSYKSLNKDKKKENLEHAGVLSKIDTLKSERGAYTQTSKGTYDGLKEIYNFGNASTKKLIGQLVDKVETDDNGSLFDGGLFGGGLLGIAEKEIYGQMLQSAVDQDKDLKAGVELMYEKMTQGKHKDLPYVGEHASGLDKDDTLDSMNEDERLNFYESLLQNLNKDVLKDYVDYAKKYKK